MTPQIHVLAASPRLAPYRERIERAIASACDKAEPHLSLRAVDLVVADNPDDVVPQTGFGGYAPTPQLLHVYCDPGHEGFGSALERELASTVVHELAHCERLQHHGYHASLLEQAVAEGLADRLDVELNGVSPRPWSVALGPSALAGAASRFEAVMREARFDHRAWFFGSEAEGIEPWSGYALGYAMVGTYLEDRGVPASASLLVDPEEVAVAWAARRQMLS